MEGHILLVEGERAAKISCAPILEEWGFRISRAHTRRAACAALETTTPDLLVIDTRYLRFNGLRFCETLSATGEHIPILLILPEDQKRPHYPGVVVLRGTPTTRKLLNRVKRLLSPPGNHLLRAGELVLDLQRRVVIRKGEEHRLTPPTSPIAGNLYAEYGTSPYPCIFDERSLGNRLSGRYPHAGSPRSLVAEGHRGRFQTPPVFDNDAKNWLLLQGSPLLGRPSATRFFSGGERSLNPLNPPNPLAPPRNVPFWLVWTGRHWASRPMAPGQ